MTSEIVTAAQIIAGTGAAGWTAAKLLGPSADAVGEHVRAFLGTRVSKIFAEVKKQSEGSDLGQLPPGFAALAIQKASISEDDKTLTSLWASLLISAATTFSTKHVVFADILSQIGPLEAKVLRNLTQNFEDSLEFQLASARAEFQNFGNGFSFQNGPSSVDIQTVGDAYMKKNFHVPGVMTKLNLNWSNGLKQTVSSPLVVADQKKLSWQILKRQGLIEPATLYHEREKLDAPKVHADFLILTDLGFEFLKTVEQRK